MSKKALELSQVGPYQLLMKEIIPFLEKWDGPVALAERDLNELAWIAIEPNKLHYGHKALEFAMKFILAPDFVPAFITLIRTHWFDTSKAAKLRIFFSGTSNATIDEHRRFRIMSNKEVNYQAMENVDGATFKDAEAARRDLHSRLNKSLPISILKKLLKS
jgi:hypothetical protein